MEGFEGINQGGDPRAEYANLHHTGFACQNEGGVRAAAAVVL